MLNYPNPIRPFAISSRLLHIGPINSEKQRQSVRNDITNRNQGGIEEAMENLTKTREQYKAAKLKRTAVLAEAFNHLTGTYDEVVTIQNDVLTNAQRAFETTYQGYEEGKFDYLYVLDTQRTLFKTQAQYIDALETYHKKLAQIERLMGRNIDSIEQKQTKIGGSI